MEIEFFLFLTGLPTNGDWTSALNDQTFTIPSSPPETTQTSSNENRKTAREKLRNQQNALFHTPVAFLKCADHVFINSPFVPFLTIAWQTQFRQKKCIPNKAMSRCSSTNNIFLTVWCFNAPQTFGRRRSMNGLWLVRQKNESEKHPADETIPCDSTKYATNFCCFDKIKHKTVLVQRWQWKKTNSKKQYFKIPIWKYQLKKRLKKSRIVKCIDFFSFFFAIPDKWNPFNSLAIAILFGDINPISQRQIINQVQNSFLPRFPFHTFSCVPVCKSQHTKADSVEATNTSMIWKLFKKGQKKIVKRKKTTLWIMSINSDTEPLLSKPSNNQNSFVTVFLKKNKWISFTCFHLQFNFFF